jgi:hypothetical protein
VSLNSPEKEIFILANIKKFTNKWNYYI